MRGKIRKVLDESGAGWSVPVRECKWKDVTAYLAQYYKATSNEL